MSNTNNRSDCCVIIVTYNARKWIQQCIASIDKSAYPVDVIIVDNNSSDETVSLIKKGLDPKLLLESKENLGFGKANNLGLEYGYKEGYDYFFLLNQDAYLNETTIGYLVESVQVNDEFGIVSPIHLNGKGVDLDNGFQSGIKSKELVNDYHNDRLKNALYEVRFVNAAAWMLSRSTLANIGLFHPLFFHYGEDKNYVSRVKSMGMKVMVDPRSVIRHDRENRGYNPLKDDPYKNHEREAWQILLNPSNPSNYFLLLLTAIKNMLVVSTGQSLRQRWNFVLTNISSFKEKHTQMKAFGGREFNPLKSIP